MTLLVRDELDIVAATIEHHLAAGVGHIIATDNGSIDGTAELLEEYQRTGALSLIHEPRLDYRQTEWVTTMARRAATDHGADWVINVDADEFLWPWDDAAPCSAAEMASYRIRDGLAPVPDECGSVVVRRDNVFADPGAVGAWPDRLIWRDRRSVTERGTPIDAKVMHRADPDVVVRQGNHTVDGARLGALADPRTAVMLHVPDRGYRQYARKIDNGGSAYAANTEFDEETGWHWRADYALLQAGRLEEVWRSRQPTVEMLAEGERSGRFLRFPHLRDRLHALVDLAVLPAALRQVLDGSSA